MNHGLPILRKGEFHDGFVNREFGAIQQIRIRVIPRNLLTWSSLFAKKTHQRIIEGNDSYRNWSDRNRLSDAPRWYCIAYLHCYDQHVRAWEKLSHLCDEFRRLGLSNEMIMDGLQWTDAPHCARAFGGRVSMEDD